MVDEASAIEVANAALARVASGRKALGVAELRVAARAEAARLLARGVAVVPADTDATGPAAWGNADAAHVAPEVSAFAPPPAAAPPAPAPPAAAPPDPRDQTMAGRFAVALSSLAPYERLACVAYFVDGASVNEIAELLNVPRSRAVSILEVAAPVLARVTGEHHLPDFEAMVDEVEVVIT